MSLIHKDGIYCLVVLVETKCSQQRKILHILQNHSPQISDLPSAARSGSCTSILSHTSLLWLLMAESSHRPVQLYSLSCNVKDLHQYLTSLAMKCLTSLDMIIFTAIKLKQSRVRKASIEKSLFLIPLPKFSTYFERLDTQSNWTELILKDWTPRCQLVNHSCSWSGRVMHLRRLFTGTVGSLLARTIG